MSKAEKKLILYQNISYNLLYMKPVERKYY